MATANPCTEFFIQDSWGAIGRQPANVRVCMIHVLWALPSAANIPCVFDNVAALVQVRTHVVDSWVGQMVAEVLKGSLSGHNGLDKESEPAGAAVCQLRDLMANG